MSKLTIRHVSDSDLSLLDTWLRKDYILKWYHDADEWLNEVRERNGSFSFLHHFMVLCSDQPIGFCQYYDCFDAKEDWYSVERAGELFSIDYLIGEEKFLGKGYGKQIVGLLIEKIYGTWPEAQIVVQPENENTASCKTLLSNGFVYEEEKKYFSLKRSCK